MAEAVANEELEKGLKQARKKPRNFLIVGTGSKPLKLVVQRKAIKPADVVDAKKEVKGTAAITGVCQGEGATMTFFITEETGFKSVGLRVLIAEETGLTLKPEFQLVPALPEVKEDDVDEDDAAASAVPSAPPMQHAPSAAPPTAPPPSGITAAQLTAALNKLTPAIQQAVAANPAKKAELLKPVADFQAKLKANDLDAAKALLATINKSVAAAASAAPPTAPPPPKADAAAKPPVAPPPPDAGAKPPLEAADGKAEGEFEKLLGSLTDRYTEVLRGQPSTASQLRGVMDFANGKAEQNDYTSAVTALTRLSGLLDKAEEELLAEAIESQIDDEDAGRGVVAYRKALLNWEAARNSAVAAIRSLQAAVAKEYPEADVDRLSEVFDEVDGSLHDALVDCINAEDEEDRQYYNAQALEVIREFESRIDGSELIQGVDKNPFNDGIALGDSLKKALGQVAAFLA